MSDFFSILNRRNDVITLILFPAGAGEIPWESDFVRDALRNAMVVGQTIDSIRLAQARMALTALRQLDVDLGRIMIAGRGESGVIGLYAAILESSIAQVMLIDPPASHRTGPTFLNILRFTDLPEAAALLAPRHLNFYSRIPAAYEPTRRVYSLYGKPENVFRALDIGAVLDGRYDLNFGSGGG